MITQPKIKKPKEKTPESASPGRARRALNLSSFLPYRFYALAFRMSNGPPSLKQAIAQAHIPISERDWRVLAVIAAHDSIKQSEISRLMGMDPATVTRALRHLEEIGLVLRRRGRADRRTTQVILSKEGARVHDAVVPYRFAFERDLLTALDSDEIADLQRLLDKLEARLSQMESHQDRDGW